MKSLAIKRSRELGQQFISLVCVQEKFIFRQDTAGHTGCQLENLQEKERFKRKQKQSWSDALDGSRTGEVQGPGGKLGLGRSRDVSSTEGKVDWEM